MATITVRPGTMLGTPITVREQGTQGPRLQGGDRPALASPKIYFGAPGRGSHDKLRGFHDSKHEEHHRSTTIIDLAWLSTQRSKTS